jgi:hypothetical protein
MQSMFNGSTNCMQVVTNTGMLGVDNVNLAQDYIQVTPVTGSRIISFSTGFSDYLQPGMLIDLFDSTDGTTYLFGASTNANPVRVTKVDRLNRTFIVSAPCPAPTAFHAYKIHYVLAGYHNIGGPERSAWIAGSGNIAPAASAKFTGIIPYAKIGDSVVVSFVDSINVALLSTANVYADNGSTVITVYNADGTGATILSGFYCKVLKLRP